ncbi:MAG: phytanoyl-CoA dioxygenase family protein [Proteobacteria bacterium]|nr:phytanoyl-CoA dioxygenase family protein [Pseudomonadota bacterium]
MNPTFPVDLSATDISAYQADGFVCTEGIFSATELAAMRDAVDAEVARRTVDDGRSVAEKRIYEQSFVQCMRLWETSQAVRPFTCHAGLAGAAAQLMGVDSVLLWQDQALYKEAGGRETTPHQDQPFWPIGRVPLISAWIPLDDVTPENGAMAYMPGSHKLGALTVVDITHSTEPYDIRNDPALADVSARWVSAKAGSVIWHNGFTVHQAAANRTASPRRVFTVVYIAAGFLRAREWPVFPLDRAGVAVGEEMRGEGMPMLWPPSNTLPEPPAELGVATGPQYTQRR